MERVSLGFGNSRSVGAGTALGAIAKYIPGTESINLARRPNCNTTLAYSANRPDQNLSMTWSSALCFTLMSTSGPIQGFAVGFLLFTWALFLLITVFRID